MGCACKLDKRSQFRITYLFGNRLRPIVSGADSAVCGIFVRSFRELDRSQWVCLIWLRIPNSTITRALRPISPTVGGIHLFSGAWRLAQEHECSMVGGCNV